MNCRQFQNQLHEYLDRSLPDSAMAEAQTHLAGCLVCREAVREEQKFAQVMSTGLRQNAEALTLRPEIRSRIIAAARRKPTPPALLESILNWWTRFPVAASASAALFIGGVVLMTSHFIGAQRHSAETAQIHDHFLPPTVSIQLSSRVPTYKFHREGNAVIDVLADETVIASVTLYPPAPRK
jgi:anti-sigma factor RsiW